MCYVIVALVVIGLGVGLYFLISSGVLSGKKSSSSASSFLDGGVVVVDQADPDTTNYTSFVEIVEKVVDCAQGGSSARRVFLEVSGDGSVDLDC